MFLLVNENIVGNWVEQANKHGLGLLLAVVITLLFIYVLRRILKNIETDRIMYKEQAENDRLMYKEQNNNDREMFVAMLNSKDTTINNHLDHVNKALNDNTLTVKMTSEEVVRAIKHQTKLMNRTLQCFTIKEQDDQGGKDGS